MLCSALRGGITGVVGACLLLRVAHIVGVELLCCCQSRDLTHAQTLHSTVRQGEIYEGYGVTQRRRKEDGGRKYLLCLATSFLARTFR